MEVVAERGVSARRLILSGDALARKQRRHFILLVLIPHVFAMAALASLFWWPFAAPEAAALGLMWIVTGIGISTGYHRLFTHASFRTGPRVEMALAIAGSMAGQGAVTSWVSIHRHHHQLSDDVGDPHSPNLIVGGPLAKLRGWLHAHLTWMSQHEFPNPVHYARDILRKRHLSGISRHYYRWVAIGILIPAIAVALWEQSFTGLARGALWGGAVRLVILSNTIWAINSFLHLSGSRVFPTRDNSRNAPLLGLLSFGESFHNNHHAFPRSAALGLGAPYLDPGYWMIALLRRMGLADTVWTPTPQMVRDRLTVGGGAET